MRQLGEPPEIDQRMNEIVIQTLSDHGLTAIDADGSTGSKDYLERILELIRSTGFTTAIFSHQTRPNTLANIALELGFAAMCGKPLIIVKSKDAVAPSDLNRTDWIVYDGANEARFVEKLTQAIDQVGALIDYEDTLLSVAINADSTDCGVAFERANKGFLLSGDPKFIKAAQQILERLTALDRIDTIGDIDRLKIEVDTFIRQATKSLE